MGITKRSLTAPVLAICLVLFLIAGGCTGEQDRKIVVQAGIGPSTAPLLLMASDTGGKSLDMELIIYKSVEEATTRIIKGEADFSLLPVNVAAKLYNKDVPVCLANVNTWGVLYLVTGDPQVRTIKDLPGKTVYVGAQGATPDVLTRYLLDKNGIRGVDIRYAQSPEIAQMLIKGLAGTAVLPEPMVTQVIEKKPDMRIAADFYDEWQRVAGSGAGLPQAGIVVAADFLKKYPGLFDSFQAEYARSLARVVADPSTAAPLVEKEMSILPPVFVKTMERTRLKFVTGKDARSDVDSYLSRLLEISPEMVGGKVPGEDFYAPR